jgi:hypothetical protein
MTGGRLTGEAAWVPGGADGAAPPGEDASGPQPESAATAQVVSTHHRAHRLRDHPWCTLRSVPYESRCAFQLTKRLHAFPAPVDTQFCSVAPVLDWLIKVICP